MQANENLASQSENKREIKRQTQCTYFWCKNKNCLLVSWIWKMRAREELRIIPNLSLRWCYQSLGSWHWSSVASAQGQSLWCNDVITHVCAVAAFLSSTFLTERTFLTLWMVSQGSIQVSQHSPEEAPILEIPSASLYVEDEQPWLSMTWLCLRGIWNHRRIYHRIFANIILLKYHF